VDLSALTTFNGGPRFNSTMSASHQGNILDGRLTTLNQITVTLDGAAPQIGNAWLVFNAGSLVVTGGAYTLPKLAGFIGSSLNAQGGTLSFAQGTVGTMNLSTGLDSSGNLITTGGVGDAHWTVQEADGSTGAAQTVFPNNADWYSGWPANGPTSIWLARNANSAGQGAAPYAFTRTFDLTGYNLSTVWLVGAWNIDDTGTLALNGHVFDTQSDPFNSGRFPTFAVSGASGFFNQGLNTLTITITASDQVNDAVRFDAILYGDLGTSNGLVAVVDSSVTAGAGGTVSLPSGKTTVSRSTISPSGGTITAGTLELGSGSTLGGTGTVMATVLNSLGVVVPANASGILQISGDYTQTASGSLATNIGGPGGGQFGHFAVSGTATLGGTFNINLVNGYYPANGLAFSILNAGTLTGRFATINGLVQHQQRTFQITYRTTSFALITVLDDLYPDLQVAALDTTPASGLHSGSSLTIHWNDINTGKAATPTGANWSDRVLVKNLTTGQTLLDTTVLYDAVNRGPIAVNGAQAQQLAYTLPNGMAGAGMIEIDVTVNVYNDVFEFNDNGTADSNNTATVTKTSVLIVPSPDLRVVNLAANFVSTRQSGATVVVSWDDANQGNAATSGSFYDTVVVTNTTTGKTIGQVSLLYNEAASGNGPIAAGDHRSRQVTLTLPDGADAVGTLSFTVTADAFNQIMETDHSHNTASVTAAVTLAPYTDLQVNNLRTVPGNGLLTGTTILIAWDDANVGTGATPAGWSDALTVSNQTTGQVLLAIMLPVNPATDGGIPGGGSKARQYSLTLPDGMPGVGTLVITVTADASNSFFEYHAGGPNPNKTATINQNVTLSAYPDLTVTQLQAPANAQPGRTVPLTWKVANQGNGTANGSWTDQVFVSPDQRTDDGLLVASFIYSGPLPAGQDVTRTEMIPIPATGLAGNYWFYVRTNGTGTVFELNTNNNTLLATQATAIQAGLTLSLGTASVSKDAGGFTATISRSGSLAAALTVNLASSDTTRLAVPALVVIPAGLASASFTVMVVQNGLADGTQNVTVSASATGLQGDSRGLQILDVNKAMLSLTVAAMQIKEGDPSPATTGRITRNTPTTQALTVSLSSTDLVRLILPDTVTIPAGQASATFPIDARRDYIIQGPQTVMLQATATGFVGTTASLILLDADVPQLGVRLAVPSSLKNAANPATTGVVTRDAVATRDLTVQLVSSDAGKVMVPAQVIIPAGQTSASFPVNVVDNHLADGTQTVTVSAFVVTTNGNTQLTQGSATTHIDLLDYHRPTLQLSLAKDLAGENSTINATLSRDQASAQPLTVSLASDTPAEATVPAMVTIPDNQTSVSFSVTAVHKAAQPATITATATGYNNGSARLLVTDQNLPDLKVSSLAIPMTGLTLDQFTVNFSVINAGLAPAFGSWTDQVYLSPTGLAKDGTLLGTFPFTADPMNGFPVGIPYSKALPFQLPNVPGDYWVIVTTNAGNTLVEGVTTNNTAVSAQPIHVNPAYTATVMSTIRTGVAGQPVLLRGSATKAGSSAPAPFVTVTVRVQLRGTRRVLTGLTDGSGNFSVVFQPLPGEGGHYQIGAAHPGVTTDPIQDDFILYGMSASPSQLTQQLLAGETVAGTFNLVNVSDIPLSGITATVLNAPANLNVQVMVGNSLPGSGTLPVSLSIRALDASVPRANITLRFGSTQGAMLDVPLQVTVNQLAPSLVSNPDSLQYGVLRGSQKVVDFIVTNQGGAASGALAVSLPPIPWLTLSSPMTIASLAPGASAKVTLVLTPPANVNLGVYQGTLVLRSSTASINVPFNFRTVSDATGNLTVSAVDEYTYYASGSPKVAGAQVTVSDPYTGAIVAQGVTDSTGVLVIHGLKEGYYNLTLQADKHLSYHKTIFVNAGSDNPIDAFMARQTVQVSWTVVPTEVQDETRIKIDTTFETNAPIPVVTIDPPLIDLTSMKPGEVRQFDLTATNHGLLAANDAQLVFGTHPNFTITALVSNIGVIPAQSSITIPVLIRRLANGPLGQDAPCSIGATLLWTLVCKDEKFTFGVPITIVTMMSGWTPGSGDGGFIPVGTPPGGGGTFFYFGGGPSKPDDCDPCKLKIFLAVLDCISGFLPIPDTIKCAQNIYKYLTSSGSNDFFSAYSDFKLILSCAKAAGAVIPWSKPLKFIDCVVKIIKAYKDCGQKNPGGQDVGNIPALLQERVDRLQSLVDAMSGAFGDVAWLTDDTGTAFTNWVGAFLSKQDASTLPYHQISAADRAALLQLPLPGQVTPAIANRFIDRWNRSMLYYSQGIFNLNQVPMGQSTDFLALDTTRTAFGLANTAIDRSIADGFGDLADALKDGVNQAAADVTRPGDQICARVHLEIDQQAVLTRDAFNATLQIANSMDAALTNVKVDVHVYDGRGADVTSLFGIRPPQLFGITAVDGTGQVAGNVTGQASWIIIPSSNAASTQPTQYFVSATLSYTDTGTQVVVPRDKVAITVLPQAELHLQYFLQRDVFGPDPFSDVQLPSEPFSLGVLVTNTGAGAARNVSITSAQPKITDNEKGLYVDFNLLASEVGGMGLSPSFTVNFGNIDPGKTADGRWLFISSIQGHFADFAASFQHLNSLGGLELSIIKSVDIHELVHVVRMSPGGLADFLAADNPNSFHIPDTLYLGNGQIFPVGKGFQAMVDGPVTPTHLQIHLTATMPAGYSYLQLNDPGNGNYHLVRVVRSDGTQIAVDDNIWETDRTFPEGGRRPIQEFLLHLLDRDSTGSYTLYYAPNDASPPQVARIDPVVPNPRSTAVSSIDVTFSKPIDAATFDYHALTLTRNGGANLITSGVTIQLVSGAHYRINGLSGLTGTEGVYVLTVSAAGIKDPLGNLGTGSASVSWTMAIQAPAVAVVTGVVTGQRNTPVTSITVQFTKPINPITLDYHALTLTRSGGANLITSAVTVTQTDFTTFRFDGLTSLTAADAHYVLTVDASGVRDTTGTAGVGSVTIAWDLTTVLPTVAAVAAPSGNINVTTDTVDVTFSEAIDPATFTTASLTLTRDGGANLITPAVTIQRLSPTQFRIGSLTALTNTQGSYSLTVSAALVRDLAGNPGMGSVTKMWTLTTTAPAAATNIVLTPHFGMPPNDNITNTLTPTLSGQLGAAGLTVGLFDLTNNRDLGQATVTGTSFSKALSFATAGNHQVRIRVSNAAGNYTDGVYTVVIDVTPPAISQLLNVPSGTTTRSVASIDVVFSKPIQATTFDRTHLSLTLNGSGNLITSAVTVTFVSGSTYRISGLADLTRAKGMYLLTINLAGVQDLYNNTANGTTTARWTNVLTAAAVLVQATEGATFNGTVATLSDGDANTQAGAYTVQINWGDGTSTTGTVQATTADNFNLIGSHRYAEEGSYAVTVTVSDNATPNNTATAGSTAAVNDAALTATQVAVSAREGIGFSGQVATFTDAGGNEPEANYSATIDWGDGTDAGMGTVRLVGGSFSVTGGHTYAEEGTYTITVTIREEGGAITNTTMRTTVADADLHASAMDQTAAENQALTNVVVASFTDDDPAGTATDYMATIMWGDNSTATTGTVSFNMQTHRFEVQASHTYAEEGNYTITVTLRDTGGANTTATSTAHVSDPTVVGTGGFSLTAVEGGDTGLQTVATFTDPAGVEAIGDYTAMIAWGDNTTSYGTITVNMTTHVYTVQASHTYAGEGAYTITVTLKHDAAPDATVTDHATIADPAVVGTGGFNVAAVEGADSGMQTVATFTDPGGTEALTDYTASINWGDNSTPTIGTISYDGTSHTFTVKGSHTYAEEGSYNVAVTVTHDTAPDATITSHAAVGDAAVVGTGGFSLTAVEGSDGGMQTVATFTDPAGAEALADYSAMIDWGDGTASTAGVITYDNASHTFTVQGNHTYAEEGTDTITVTLQHDTAPDASVTSTATVADADLHAAAKALQATEGRVLKRAVVATFTDDDPNATANLFTATIDWGDGSSSVGKVRATKRGRFQVLGAHTYLNAGAYAVTVDITDLGGSTAEVAGTATVADATLHATGYSIKTITGQAFQARVASFTDDDPNATAGLFTALINWGDGTTDQVAVQANANGGFDVLGSHTYAQNGRYTVTVDITDEGSSTAEVTGTAKAGHGGVPLDQAPGGHKASGDWTTALEHRRLTDDFFSGGDGWLPW
jgi:hypothetical protein